MKAFTKRANEIKNNDRHNTWQDPESLNYLQKQFPWFTLAEIEQAAKNGCQTMEQLIADLERKSGKRSTESIEDF